MTEQQSQKFSYELNELTKRHDVSMSFTLFFDGEGLVTSISVNGAIKSQGSASLIINEFESIGEAVVNIVTRHPFILNALKDINSK